jgi:hypothetical protein
MARLHAPELRNKLVAHEGKSTILIEIDAQSWTEIIQEIRAKVTPHINADLQPLFSPNFSTTGAVEQTVYDICLLDLVNDFFKYKGMIKCGIPEITLEGTPADWKQIQANLDQIAAYDLAWWIEPLKPIIAEFVHASEGKVNVEFWQELNQKCSVGCGTIHITGWIGKFFPYVHKDRNRQLFFDYSTLKKDAQTGYTRMPPSVELGQVHTGLSKVNFEVDNNGAIMQYELVSGLIGIQQDSITAAVKPQIAWAIVELAKEP